MPDKSQRQLENRVEKAGIFAEQGQGIVERVADGFVGNVHDFGDFADAKIFVIAQRNRFQLAFGEVLKHRCELLGELFFLVVNAVLLAGKVVLVQESVQLHFREIFLLFGDAVDVAAKAAEEVELDIIYRGHIGVTAPEVDEKVLNSVLHAGFIGDKTLAVGIQCIEIQRINRRKSVFVPRPKRIPYVDIPLQIFFRYQRV